jgi:heterodisulfide reductase subunit A
MVAAAQHPNIELMTYSEIEDVQGYIGNFQVKIRQKAKYVNHSVCTGCGLCETKCPTKVPSEFDQGLGKRTSIYKPFPQAVPSKPVIDNQSCRKLLTGKCGICAKVCPLGCIDFEDQDKYVTETFGAIVMATGYDLIDWAKLYGEYGYGKYPDVIDGLQFERMSNASGPTEGKIVRPSDGKTPKSVVIVKCVGSRDPNKGRSYCSRACCMYAAKHAHQVLEKCPDSQAYVFYMDVRTPGKAYEEFYMKTLHDGAVYVRGRISKIYEEDGKLFCCGEDTLVSKNVVVEADLVVLETAMVPSADTTRVAQMIGAGMDKDGWLQEAHPKLRPVETHTGGVFLAGTCQGPKDIPDTVAQASAAAIKVCALFSKDEMDTDPMISHVNTEKCSGCGFCAACCPYKAIELKEIDSREDGKWVKRKVASVNTGLCQGCGACVVACRPGAIDLLGYTNGQILEEVDALCL